MRRARAWRARPTFAPHPRIAEHARELGLFVIETAGGDAGLIAGLLEWTRRHPERSPDMPNPDIIVTAPLPPFLYDPLKRGLPLPRLCQGRATSRRSSRLRRASIRGLVQGGGTVTPTTLLDALPKLEIISVFGVGYDGVPVDYCRKRGIKVTNTPDVLTDDVADVAVGLVLMTGRGFVRANRFVHAGDWLKKGPELTTKLSGQERRHPRARTHRQGDRAAARGDGHADRLHGRKPQDVPYRFVPDLKALAAAADFLIVACPGGAATQEHRQCRRAGGAREERHARQHRARLDRRRARARRRRCKAAPSRRRVWMCSPTSRNIPPALLAMDNVVLLPHVGSATHETRKAMGDLCKANLDAWFAGKPLPTLIPELT